MQGGEGKKVNPRRQGVRAKGWGTNRIGKMGRVGHIECGGQDE